MLSVYCASKKTLHNQFRMLSAYCAHQNKTKQNTTNWETSNQKMAQSHRVTAIIAHLTDHKG